MTPLDANTASRQCLLFLMFTCLAWELFLAPLRPGGSWLALKALPLAAALPGVWRGKRYTHKWSSMLILIYMAEGLVRGIAESGISQWLALMESALAVGFLVFGLEYLRSTGPDQEPPTGNRPWQN